MWQSDSFPLFCPQKKWTTTEHNLQVGDIVLLQYEQQLGKDTFRLEKLTTVHPDVNNVVHTVTVRLRNLRKVKREDSNNANAPQTTITVSIQRLVVLLPVEETWSQGLLRENTSHTEKQ